MRRKIVVTSVILFVAVVLASLFVAVELGTRERDDPEFFVGVECAYSYTNGTNPQVMIDDVKTLVDKVKNYTNLFVIGSIELTYNSSALNEACDYIRDAGLYFIVLLTGRNSYSYPQQPFDWLVQAQQRYGEKFLGVYRYDEPGGNQLDQGGSQLISAQNRSEYTYVTAAETFTYYLQVHIEPFIHPSPRVTIPVFTADYGLYWFDYSAGYDMVLAEFGANQSRQLNIALNRGAAGNHGKNWGAILTWTYDQPPYIESADELYNDLAQAYCCGAKYAVVFDYPKDVAGDYGILTEAHFEAIQRFWNDLHTSGAPSLTVQHVDTAYVLPEGYGFGFRSATDTLWGLWPADNLSAKVWADANNLIGKYGCNFDIVYDEPQFRESIQNRYSTLIYWNQTVT